MKAPRTLIQEVRRPTVPEVQEATPEVRPHGQGAHIPEIPDHPIPVKTARPAMKATGQVQAPHIQDPTLEEAHLSQAEAQGRTLAVRHTVEEEVHAAAREAEDSRRGRHIGTYGNPTIQDEKVKMQIIDNQHTITTI